MLLIGGAVAAGIVGGLVTGGRLRALGDVHFRWWPLAILGLALQFVPTGRTKWLGTALLIASYAVLLAFVAANLRYRGFVVMAVGFALNLLVISLNGGMPVSDRALRSAYEAGYRATLADLREHGGAKHHLRRPDDDLTPLSDVIPIGGPVHEVYSPGDVLALVGLAVVAGEATHRFRRLHHPALRPIVRPS